jgi:putative membrane protein (TIGR04086 family)
MKYLKKLGFSFLYTIACLFIITFITTILNYFNIISDNVISIFKILIPVISLFIGGFYIGKKSNNKGYLEGLKFGLIFCTFLLIFNFLAFSISFKLKYLLFYLIIIISSILGSMVGININKKNQ